MKCPSMHKKDVTRLFSYVSQRLDRKSRAQVNAHLAECDRCAENVAAHRELWDVLDDFEPAPVSFDFERKLFQRIEEDRSRSWLHRAAVAFFPLAARPALPFALAVLCGVSLFVQHPHQSPPPADPMLTQVAPAAAELTQSLDDLQLLQQLDARKGKTTRTAGSL